MLRKAPLLILLWSLLIGSAGCSAIVGRASSRLADDLSAAILEQDDLETVRDGAPAYLLAVDGMIEGQPENIQLLSTGARLYSAYASAFVENPERRIKMTTRALGYARRALCLVNSDICAAIDEPYDAFAPSLATATPKHLAELYGFGSAWATWVQANAGDWGAVAELPKIQALMERVIELDESYDDGQPHLVLGVLDTLRPASMGGQPEKGRDHFERAIEISQGQNLMAKVMLAESYARLIFDKELHDRLLEEVLAADPHSGSRTLVNTMAQLRAQELLADSDEYF